MHICHRQTFWKEKKYKTVEKGKNWTIERIVEDPQRLPAPDLEKLLNKFFKKKEKWK